MGWVIGSNEEQIKPNNKTILSSQLSDQGQSEAKIMTVVAKMREEFEKSFTEKSELLEQAIAQLLSVTPDSRILKQAQAEAHRLAGSLGCYGFLEGSKVAQKIEQLLDKHISPHQSMGLQLGELVKLLKQTLQQQPSSPTDYQ